MAKGESSPKKSRFLDVPVEPFEARAGDSADEILRRMERISFQGRNLAVAHRVWKRMLADYQPPEIDPSVDAELQAFMAERKGAVEDAWY